MQQNWSEPSRSRYVGHKPISFWKLWKMTTVRLGVFCCKAHNSNWRDQFQTPRTEAVSGLEICKTTVTPGSGKFKVWLLLHTDIMEMLTRIQTECCVVSRKFSSSEARYCPKLHYLLILVLCCQQMFPITRYWFLYCIFHVCLFHVLLLLVLSWTISKWIHRKLASKAPYRHECLFSCNLHLYSRCNQVVKQLKIYHPVHSIMLIFRIVHWIKLVIPTWHSILMHVPCISSQDFVRHWAMPRPSLGPIQKPWDMTSVNHFKCLYIWRFSFRCFPAGNTSIWTAAPWILEDEQI